MAQEPHTKNTHNLTYSRESLAVASLSTLMKGWAQADNLIMAAADAWRNLEAPDRQAVAQLSHELVDVLCRIEDHDAKRRLGRGGNAL